MIREPAFPAAVASVTEHAFAALSGVRRRRIFHPHGLTFGGRLFVTEDLRGVSFLRIGATHPVLVRFSRALGTPRGRADFLGLAVRIASEQDLLLASSLASPVVRCLPIPARTFAETTFSSLLPFDASGRVVLVGARVHHVEAAAEDQLAQLEAASAVAPVAVTLAVAELAGGWRRIGRIEVLERVPGGDAGTIAFDPWVCDGGLVPRGWLNALRAPAYRGSRRGRADLAGDGANV